MGKQIISAAEAARIIGCNPQKVRMMVQAGLWKFGRVIPKEKTGYHCDRYEIYRPKLERYLGVSGGENHD